MLTQELGLRSLYALTLIEVMDKEPHILTLWLSAIVLGSAGFFLARRRWWWGLPVLIMLAVSFITTWSDWTDSFVGAAIAREAGRFYPDNLVASTILAGTATIVGMIRPRRV